MFLYVCLPMFHFTLSTFSEYHWKQLVISSIQVTFGWVAKCNTTKTVRGLGWTGVLSTEMPALEPPTTVNYVTFMILMPSGIAYEGAGGDVAPGYKF